MKILGMCLNWKVVAGLSAVAVGFFIVAPNVALAALPVLLVLACPLSCLFMMRGMGSGSSKNNQSAMSSNESGAQGASCCMPSMRSSETSTAVDEPSEPRAVPLSRDGQLAQLTDQLARIQAEQDALAREIAALEEPTLRAVVEAEDVALAANGRVADRS